jgi:hypothetical protein
VSPQLKVAWVVIIIYLVTAILVAGVFALIIWATSRDQDKDPKAQQIMREFGRIADMAGTSVWGLCVYMGLRWPLMPFMNIRKDC